MNASESWGSVLSKLLIAVFLVLAAVGAAWTGINAWELSKEKKATRADEKRMKQIEKLAPTVKELWQAGSTAERLKEERRTGNWTTFFASTAQASGLSLAQYKPPAMKTSPGRGYFEHYFEIRLNPKTGVKRQSLARFLHAVESRRTYIKTKSIELKRLGEDEDWGGVVVFAYREKR